MQVPPKYEAEEFLLAFRAFSLGFLKMVCPDLCHACYHLSYSSREDGAFTTRQILMWSEDDLLDFCDNVKAGYENVIINIAELDLGPSDEVEDWQWEPIKEIWCCSVHPGQEEIIYIKSAGKLKINNRSIDSRDESSYTKRLFSQVEGCNPK